MVPLLKPKRAGHSAAARLQQFEIQAQSLQQFLFRIDSHNRLMMAMRMNDGLAFELQSRVIRREFAQKLTQQISLLAKPKRILIVWKQALQFIAEHRAATRLEHNHR